MLSCGGRRLSMDCVPVRARARSFISRSQPVVCTRHLADTRGHNTKHEHIQLHKHEDSPQTQTGLCSVLARRAMATKMTLFANIQQLMEEVVNPLKFLLFAQPRSLREVPSPIPRETSCLWCPWIKISKQSRITVTFMRWGEVKWIQAVSTIFNV